MEGRQGASGSRKYPKQLVQSRDESQGTEDQGEQAFSGPSRLERGHCSLLPHFARIAEDRFTVTLPGKYTDDQGHHSDVAVKVPKADLGLLSQKAIRNELEVLSQLQEEGQNANVVHCLGGSLGDVAEWDLEGLDHIQVQDQKDCVVLEQGVNTLHQVLYENQEFAKAATYRKLIKIFIGVARGLEHVHQSNVVHSRLSLANVVMDQEGRAKLAGFQASVGRPKKHIPWQLCGVCGYIAPELFCAMHNGKDLKISDNIDTFSLGVMMLECLTRTHPHEVQQEKYPKLWELVYGCCENYVHDSGTYGTSISTHDTAVRDSLGKVLHGESLAKLLPWPDAFWRLLDHKDGVEDREISMLDANEVVKKLRQHARNQSRSVIDPWPPELCLLIAQCVSFVVDDEQHLVKRPSAKQIADSLEEMLDDKHPWLDNVLPWAIVGSERVALSQEMKGGSCRFDYPEEKLGEGAFGSVFKGLYKDDYGCPHDVAIKLVTKHKETIKRELEVFEELYGTRNVVRCFGGSFGDGQWDMQRMKHMKHIEIDGKEDFLVLEYLPKNLHQLVYEDKEFETECTYARLIPIFIDIARGLQYLHEHKIVHFDLKPTNVLIRHRGTAEVTDFGVSKIRVKDSITQSHRGTAGYIAPELSADTVGKSVRVCDNVDIYSLGAIMLECLTRKAPTDFAQYCGKRSTGETMSDLEAECPELWALVRECCNCHKSEEDEFVARPTPATVIDRLEAMFDRPWARKFVSWVPCGSCIRDYGMTFHLGWPFFGGVYKDNDGVMHDVAIWLGYRWGLGPEYLKNDLQAFDKLGNGHPNVVKCYGGNVDGFDWGASTMDRIDIDVKENFLVLEFLPRSLDGLLHADRKFRTNCTYKRLIELSIDIARGLEFLHENGVVHGDLTPSAVWIDEDGRAKLTLFGKEASKTKHGRSAPQPCIAPQSGDARVWENLDIRSLGQIIHECLTRKCPKKVAHGTGRPTGSVEVGWRTEREAPQLWALVRDCCNLERKDGQDCCVRPSPAAVVERLVAMLNLPWTGRLVPAAKPGSCTLDLQGESWSGNFGVVYRGVYIDNHGEDHNVAIKVAGSHEDAIASLKNEWQAFEKLGNGHPNVVKCYGGNVDGFDWGASTMDKIEIYGWENFLVVEFLPQRLYELLYVDEEFQTTWTYKRLIEIFIDIAKGLQFLHEKGVVHLNLTPLTVLIDEDGRAKITGFRGTESKSVDSLAVRDGYIAPEVASAAGGIGNWSKNSDIVSLGKIMHECHNAEYVRRIPLQLSAELEDLIAKCCSMEVNDSGWIARPTAGEVVTELEAMLSNPWVDETLPWTPIGPLQRLMRILRRTD